MTLTLIWPGYSSSCSIFLAISLARKRVWASSICSGFDDDADLAAGLDGVALIDALEGRGDLLELLEALDVVGARFAAGAGAGAGDGVCRLHEDGFHRFGLDVAVVRHDRVDDVVVFFILFGEVCADLDVGALLLVVDRLADVVQQAGALGEG